MAVDALTPAEIAALGVNVSGVPGVGSNAFVGMTPNELKEALDRRGIGYDRGLLGQMQTAYADLFGSGSKGKGKKGADDEDLQVISDQEKDLVNAYNGGKTGGFFADIFGAPSTGKDVTVSTGNTGVDVSKVGNGTSTFTDTDLFAGRAPPAAPPVDIPSLPSFSPAAPAAAAVDTNTNEDFSQLDPEFGAKSPSEALAANRGKDYAPPNEVYGWDQDFALGSTNTSSGVINVPGFGRGSDKQGASGETGGRSQGGAGSNGNGSGSNGVGNGADAGSGTAGAGQSGEGGQWMVGTADTGDDGDMVEDEPVNGQVHENEAVLPEDMRNDIGKDVLAEAIGLYQDDGLTPRERVMALKELLGEWAAS